MVAMLGGDYGIPGSSPGWTKYAERDENRDLTGQAFYKVATGNEPSSYTWSIIRGSGQEIASGTIAAFRGADTDDPMFSFAINGETSRTEHFSDCPSTSGVAGGALICVWIHDDPQRPQAPSGMIPLSVFTIPGLTGNDDGHATAYKILSSSGSTGIKSAALNTSIGGGGNDLAIAVVVRPGGEGSAPPTEDLVEFGDRWSYLDDGSNQGSGWREPGFDDSSWATGRGELGYGDGDETTVVASGGSGNRHITTYFRRDFTVADPDVYDSLTVSLKRDDGAVVYINGVEVARSNMAGGSVGYRTRASAHVTGHAESAVTTFTVSSSVLEAGSNVIAVEIHQRNTNSSDITFDLALNGLS